MKKALFKGKWKERTEAIKKSEREIAIKERGRKMNRARRKKKKWG